MGAEIASMTSKIVLLFLSLMTADGLLVVDAFAQNNNISGVGNCNIIIQAGSNNVIYPAPCAPKTQTSYKVCMGNGGGPNCLSGAQAAYNCDFYKGIGGGGP